MCDISRDDHECVTISADACTGIEGQAFFDTLKDLNDISAYSFSFVISTRKFVCKILGFHGGDYEEWCFLGCYAVWLL
jgi:hypothetical protein